VGLCWAWQAEDSSRFVLLGGWLLCLADLGTFAITFSGTIIRPTRTMKPARSPHDCSLLGVCCPRRLWLHARSGFRGVYVELGHRHPLPTGQEHHDLADGTATGPGPGPGPGGVGLGAAGRPMSAREHFNLG
jgi:hypothetical protein